MFHLLRTFNDLPIERKLLLTSVIPVIALLLLSLVTYRSVQAFSDDEERLNNIYLVQRRAAEYMRLTVDMESGFRGYVLTGQEVYLTPYRIAHNRIVSVGEAIEFMVQGRPAQLEIIRRAQGVVKLLITDKDRLITAVQRGRAAEALQYIERGLGRTHMTAIRESMARFDRLEQEVLNDVLLKLGHDRSSMILSILGGGFLALVLMILAQQLIARSITRPLVALAEAVGAAKGGSIPTVPILARRDEIGVLTQVIATMSAQVRDHLAQIEKSQAELRSLNRDLAASEANYRSIVDHAPFGIFTTNGMALTFINRYNRALAGLDPNKESDPEAIRQLIHPDDRERVLSGFAQAVAENRPYETVFRFQHPDGTVRKVLSRRIPIHDEQGRTIMYQGFNIDITALDHMQAQLSRAERLATLGQVAAGIAHEIRNPLVGIGSTASLLLDETDPSDARRADLELILNETRRLDRIVNQIIDYARPRAPTPTVFSVPELIEDALKLLEASFVQKKIRVTRVFEPNLPHLEADRDQIKQVLLNLLQNALEATPKDGAVSLSASKSDSEGEPGLIISVVDTGVGIAPDDLAHVFEPFFTTGKHQGTGLGLAICRNIIDAHSGDVTLTSQAGAGTTVRVRLPLRQRPQMRI